MDNVEKNKSRDYHYQEVDLIDYVKIVLKWKWLIIAFFLLAVATAGGVSKFILGDIYEVETILEIGEARGGLENPIQVVEKVDASAYFVRIDMGFLSSDIKAETPEGTNLVKINVETSDAEKAKAILAEINSLIVLSHKEEFEKRTQEIGKEIAGIQSQLEFVKARKAYTESIAPLYLKVSGLGEILSKAKMTRVVKEPTSSESPIRPNITLNTAIAGALALFSGIFLAFALEWWKSYKDK